MTADHDRGQRIFDVAMNAVMPPLLGLPKVVAAEQVLPSTLAAVYCDTDDLALAAAGITLRRRLGASDAGWHLKLPRRGDDRAEMSSPLSQDDTSIPRELLSLVAAWVRDGQLRQVATLSTHRVVHQLVSERGKVLAEVTDDVVTATATPSAGAVLSSTWREWEIELVAGSRKLLGAADELFAAAGATASAWPSKLHRALDRRQDPRPPAAADLTDRSPAGAVLHVYIAAQVSEILHRDGAVRAGSMEAVHKMRVATRRLRSALSTFAPLVEAQEMTDPIREELKWLAATLGGARDVQVQRAHLITELATEPADLVLGPVATRIEVELQANFLAAQERLLTALESSRYFHLLDRLEHLVGAPPFTKLASGKARSVLRQRVSHACRKLYELAAMPAPADPSGRETWLHEVRKAAKQVRYAAEAATPTLGKPAAALVASVTAVQESLGDHQDSVVLREMLRDLGVRMFLDGDNPFTIGRLHAIAQARGEAAERAFQLSWSTGVAEQVRSWRH